MSIDSILQVVHDFPLAAAIREQSLLFPAIETLHVLAFTIVLGTIAIVDLRLLGLSAYTARISKLTQELLPVTWMSFIAAVVFGTLLFISNPLTYFHSDNFRAKFALMGLAGVNMMVFHLLTQRGMDRWDSDTVPPAAVRLAGLMSIVLWALVVFFGRRVGFFLVNFTPDGGGGVDHSF